MCRNEMGVVFISIFLLSLTLYPWVWPTTDNFITGDFGPRHICGESWRWHSGVDIRGDGAKIFAADSGKLDYEGGDLHIITIKHPGRTPSVTRYLHCKDVVGTYPRDVRPGEVIGHTGDAGCEGKPHLHFDFGHSTDDGIHPLIYLPYSNSGDPTVKEITVEPLKKGDTVEGTVKVKAYVLTTTDKDLNKCELYIDDELLAEDKGGTISYDPKKNCSSTTAFPRACDLVGDDYFVFTWNTNDVENGEHTLKIVATDAGDKTDDESKEVYVKNDAPVVKEKCVEKEGGGSLQRFVLSNSANLSAFMEGTVCFLYPYAEDVPIDISKLSFTFSKPMDPATTTPAVSAPFGFITSWDGEETIELTLNDNLEYCKDYTVTISGDATDTSGVHLDGDENGEAGGNYIFTLTTESPELLVSAYPVVANVEEGQSVTHHVLTSGAKLKDEVNCNIRFDVNNPGGWSVNGASDQNFSLAPAGSFDKTYSVSNNGATASLDVLYQVGAECSATNGEGYYWSAQGHMADHPDENQSPGKMEYPTPWITRTQSLPALSSKTRGSSVSSGLPNIGILLSGWSDGYGHILGRYKIETLPVKPDLKIINNPDVDISDAVKLLVIGSAGLKGFISQEFKQKLEEYVVNGGNLLVFTQKYGTDLSVLPGNIEGYGWNEDQSCFKSAAYLSQWHPVFAGQATQVMTCNVDGYISEYPVNSEVLLNRTKNGMPALLFYDYGAGTVIVSSLYTDWGYGHNQSSGAELSLIRDLTTWALNPEIDIPEFYRGSAISVPVSIKYTANDTSLATTAIIKVYTPDRKLYDSIAVPLSLHSSEETEWLWNKSSILSDIGLWIIDYALVDSSGNWIQGYNRGAVFAHKIKVPVGNYALGDFQLWVTSDKEEVLNGDTVNFEIFIKNNTDSLFTGKLMVALNHRTVAIDSFLNIILPPDSTINMNYTREISSSYTWRFGLYENDQYQYAADFQNALASNGRGILEIRNPFSISLSRDKRYKYVLGIDSVHYKVTVENKISDSCSPYVNVYALLDSVRYDIWGDTLDIAGGDKEELERVFFPVDFDTTIGKQQLCCELIFRDSVWNSASVNFELTYPDVQCSLAIPDSFNYGDSNLYTVTLISKVGNLPPGKLLLSGVVYFDSLVIDYTTGSDTTLVFDYQPGVWWIDKRVSNNKLGAQYEYGSQIVSKEKNLNFQIPLISAFRPEYPGHNNGFLPGDTAVFNAQLSLKGSLYGAPLEFCLWSDYLGADTLRDTIILNPCKTQTITLKDYADLSIPPDTMISCGYQMNYLSNQYTKTGELQYFIAPPEAVLHWPVNDTFSIGSTIPIRFTNSIKTPSRVYIDSIVIYGNGANESFVTPGEVTVPGEGYYTFPITVPELKKGKYFFKIIAYVIEGESPNLGSYPQGCPIYIDGIDAEMEVSTSKEYYGYGEDIPFSSLLENGEYGWNGAETLKVARVSDSLGKFSIWDLADTVGVDTFGLIPDGDGGLVLDSVYSLREYTQISYLNNEDVNSFAVDEYDNLWVLSYNFYDDKIFLRKWDKPSGNLLAEYIVPDSLGNWMWNGSIRDLVVYEGIVYFISIEVDRKLYKFNPASGEIVGCIQPPARSFIDLNGVEVKENGNILALEDTRPGIVWELSSSGDSIAAYVLPDIPSNHHYYDIAYNDGTVYIATSKDILRIRESVVDTLYQSGGYGVWACIDVTDNGKLIGFYSYAEGSSINFFTPDGEIEAWTGIYFAENVFCYKNDIIAKWQEKLDIYREFGKDCGMIKAFEYPRAPRRYKLHSSEIVDDPKSGSISYEFLGPMGNYPDEETLLPLENMYGKDSIPPLYITMQGDWQNSPVFNDCLLNLKVLGAIDSLVVKNYYPLNLSPFESLSFVDTVKDTIPAGDYAVLGDAYSDYPQHISSDWESFTVIGNNLTLILNSDKEEGFAGDTFKINPLTINPLPLTEDSLRLLVKGYFNENETTYVDTSFILSAESTDSFPFTVIPEEPFVVRAELITPSDTFRNEFTPIVKSTGFLFVNITAPDMTDFQPFGVISKVYNHSFDDFSVEVNRSFLSDTLIDTVDLKSGGSYTFIDTFSTTSPDTIKVVALTGGQVFAKQKYIDLGIKGIIELDSLYEVSPDSVRMSGIIHNDGAYTLEGNALFCMLERTGLPVNGLQLTASELTADSQQLTANFSGFRADLPATLSAQQIALASVGEVGEDLTFSEFISSLLRAGIDTSFSAVYLAPGKSDTIPIAFDKHSAGNYTLKGFLFAEPSSVMLDSASADVNVVSNNQVFVDSLLVSPACDSTGVVPLYAVLSNDSYSPFSGNLTINSPVCYLDSTVDLSYSAKDTVMFILTDPIDEGVYTFTATITEGGFPVSEKTQNLEFYPIYRFDSLPIGLEVVTPDSGIMEISVTNIGNAKGERKIRVNLADAISINGDVVIEPASSDTFTTNFLIPEDFPGGEYFADASIFKSLYPEVDTFFNVKVNGLVIQARDSLDKLIYNVNDTCELSILVENKSLWSGNLLASLQYGELELDTSFVLGGMEKGVLNTTPNRDTLYLDSSGAYMFDPISVESYDSVSIDWDISSSDSIGVQIRTDSLIGRGSWITFTDSLTYPVSNWMQLKIENISQSTQWVNLLGLNFKPTGSIELDTFPVQKETITLDVPVDSSEKELGWGIYYPSGRSIVLDERYVYLADSMLTIFTDKGRYEISDTVHATLYKNFPDTNYILNYRVYFSPTRTIRDSFALEDDTTQFSFVIPEWTLSGTYSIDYWVEDGTADGGPLTALQLTASELTADGEQLTADLSGFRGSDLGVSKEETEDGKQQTEKLTADGGPQTALAKQWVLGKPTLSAYGDSAFISGEHLFDVDGITVYFKNARMDTNLYHQGEIAKIRTEISSDIDLTANLNISSTGSVVSDIALDLVKDIPNKFEFDYSIEGCERGINELYLHLAKDSMSLAGTVLYFDVYVGDTLAPLISVLSEPSNTYSSNRFYELIARIYDPDTSGTPFTDTLYYRVASSGGSYWQSLSAHSVKGDTNKYLIPSQPNGTHLQYRLIARDEFGNVGRYPEEGESDFWVLSPLKPTWEILTYSSAPSAILQWNSPEELVYYHSGLYSDTINISQTEIATRFTSQCQPASLERIGLDIINEDLIPSSDTFGVSVYTVEDNLLPGTKIDSFMFIDTIAGYEEFNLSGLNIPEEGIYIGIKGSSNLDAVLDGFGEGTHTVTRTGGLPWQFMTPGELLIDGLVSHTPSTKLRGPSDIFSFDVFKSTDLLNWTKITSGLTGTFYADTAIQENMEYSYRIMVSFGNPVDSFFSVSRTIFVDFTPPILDTISIGKFGENILISATLKDTSGIAWDSLGYRNDDTIDIISEDSSGNNEHFFSLYFTGDTLFYYLKAQDLSLIGNTKRYPDTGFYKWWTLAGIAEVIPDSTYLCRMSNLLVERNIVIKYALSKKSNVGIMLFDITGRRVGTLVNHTQNAGYYSVPLRAYDLPYGVYFLRMQAGDYKKTVKLVKVR